MLFCIIWEISTEGNSTTNNKLSVIYIYRIIMNREYINKLIKCRRVGKLIKLCDDNLYYWSEDDYDYLINNERYQKERKFVTKKNKYIYVYI